MGFLVQFFTWWNGQTLGTRLFTWRRGRLVGTDERGNRYYVDPDTDRRWVIYSGYTEPSTIPPGWHAWIHHRSDVPPAEDDYRVRPWEKPHQPNLTGTPFAYRPRGSLASGERRPAVTGDYEAWRP